MKCNCCSIDNKIACICENNYSYFFNKKNVIGVGCGYKVTKGFYTTQKCIAVFVVKKVSSNQLCPNDLIPACYQGIATDVVEGGIPTLQSLTQRVRPVIGGYSIGAVGIRESCSVGCLLTDGKYKYMLTSNHAIVTSPYSIGTNILQPSVEDGGKYPDDQVGTISKFVPIKPRGHWTDPKNKADAAAVIVLEESKVSPMIYYIGTPPLGVTAPKLKEVVQKVGRTTEYTEGQILYKDLTVGIFFHEKEYVFVKCVATSKMSEEGDSGSLLLDRNKNAVGLVMGGLSSYTVCNNIVSVLDKLDLKLITQ